MDAFESVLDFAQPDYQMQFGPTQGLSLGGDYLDGDNSFGCSHVPQDGWRYTTKDDPYSHMRNSDYSCGVSSFPGQTHEAFNGGYQDNGAYVRFGSPVDTISSSNSGWDPQASIDPRFTGIHHPLPADMMAYPSDPYMHSHPSDAFETQATMQATWNHGHNLFKDEEMFNDPYITSPNTSTSFFPSTNLADYASDDMDEGHGYSTNPTTPEERASEAEDNDSDWKPPSSRSRGRHSFSRQARSGQTSFKIHKSVKQTSGRASKSKFSPSGSMSSPDPAHSSMEHDATYRFPCPLKPYGCASQFKSKNEWKRHIQSQHLALGYWKCDLCGDERGPNLFNRKDLFTAHLTRMHFPKKENTEEASSSAGQPDKKNARSNKKQNKPKNTIKPSKKADRDEVVDTRLKEASERCWNHVRSPPTELTCVICNKEFSGKGSCDDWLEHVGKHLTHSSKPNGVGPTVVGYSYIGPIDWEADKIFASWLLKHDLLEEAYPRSGEGRLKLVEKSMVEIFAQNGNVDDEDVDAEGDDDE